MTSSTRVALILTGGTIDSIGADRLDLAWYAEYGQRLASGDLLARVPELSDVARVVELPFRRIASQAITSADWLDLASCIQRCFDNDEADGVVISHGTNTLEETAFFLQLVVKSHRPVVIVGAMRPSSALSADGYLNLLNAVRVAADPQSVGLGVLTLLNDTIYSARDVTKTATYRLDAFRGGDLGPLGYADADGRVVYYHRPIHRHTTASAFGIAGLTSLPRVDVVTSYVDADGTMIDALVVVGAKGIVSSGTGAGRPTPLEEAALVRASGAGVVICQASRVGSGRVVLSPKLRKQGWVAADNLVPWKARIVLSLALVSTNDPDAIQELLESH